MEEKGKLMIEAIFNYFGPGTDTYSELMNIGRFKYIKLHTCEDAFQRAVLNAGIKVHTYHHNISLDMTSEEQVLLRSWFTTVYLNQCTDLTKNRRESRYRTNVFSRDRNLNPFSFYVESNCFVYRVEPFFEEDHKEDIEEKDKIVRRGLLSIPDLCKVAFMRHHFEGKRYREIAEELGIPTGTVKSRINTAKRKFLESLLASEKEFLREVA